MLSRQRLLFASSSSSVSHWRMRRIKTSCNIVSSSSNSCGNNANRIRLRRPCNYNNNSIIRHHSGGGTNSSGLGQRASPKASEKKTPSTAAAAETTTTTSNNKNILPLRIVESSQIKESLPFIGHGAYMALASGFLLTDMLQLRLFLVGGYTGLVMFHLLHRKPLRIPLRWSALFVFVNAGAACYLIADRYGGDFTEEDERLYNEHFATSLTRGQFKQLLSLGTRQREVPDGQVLTVEGMVCKYIYFIEKGKAKVYHHQAFVSNINQGGFVNDVAFNQGAEVGAYGTVLASGNCSLIVWDQTVLREYMKHKLDMKKNMKHCLSEHLVKTLLEQREAAHQRQMKDKSYDSTLAHRLSNNKIQHHRRPKTLQNHMTVKRSKSENKITWIHAPQSDENNGNNNNNTTFSIVNHEDNHNSKSNKSNKSNNSNNSNFVDNDAAAKPVMSNLS